jgi:hypothetical protein
MEHGAFDKEQIALYTTASKAMTVPSILLATLATLESMHFRSQSLAAFLNPADHVTRDNFRERMKCHERIAETFALWIAICDSSLIRLDNLAQLKTFWCHAGPCKMPSIIPCRSYFPNE